MLIQWGIITSNEENYTQTFIIAFSNGCSPLLVTDYITSRHPGENGYHPTEVSNTSFTMLYEHNGTSIKWLAIGY